MTTAQTPPAKHEAKHQPASFGSEHIVYIFFVAIGAWVAARFLDGGVPVVAAALVAALVPKEHGWSVRGPIAVTAGLLALLIVRMWPMAGAGAEAAAPPAESAHLLSWIIGLPIAGAIAVLLIPRESQRALQWTTLGLMLATLAISLRMLSVPMGRGYHFNQDIVWLPRFGVHYHVAVDGISLWLVLLTTFITPIAAYASFGSPAPPGRGQTPESTSPALPGRGRTLKEWCFALLLLEAGMLGSFLALDLFVFYVFWELMLVPMYVMIGVWGGSNRIKAAIKFFLYTMFGSVLMLAAILYCGIQARTFDVVELQQKLPLMTEISPQTQSWLFAAFAVSFAIKVPLFPFHTWLPDAHVEAPTAGSVILAGVLLKMGTYGFLRFAIPFFPQAAQAHTPLIVALSTIGILYGSLMAMAQSDIKKLVAYSSVAHLGFCMLGIFSGTLQGAQGGVLQMVNHGLSTGALFLLVGVIYEKTHRRGVDDFGGMAKVMPVYATLFMIVTLSSIGLPGLNGFVGEFLVLFGAFPEHPKATAFAAVGVVLGAVYMLKLYRDVFFGPVTRPEREGIGDVGRAELGYLLPIVALIILLGILPNLVLSKTERAVDAVVKTYRQGAR